MGCWVGVGAELPNQRPVLGFSPLSYRQRPGRSLERGCKEAHLQPWPLTGRWLT